MADQSFTRQGRAGTVAAAVSALLLVFSLIPEDLFAFPFFTRQVGRDCTYCHTAFPRLNETGRTFRSNGYRFEAEGEWRDVKDITSVPVSFEVEVEALYDRIKTNGATAESSDMKVEEAEIIAGGAFGKTGRLTALVTAAVAQADSTFETSIPRAFIQVNDLAGPAGAGLLNVKAGIGEIALPFLTPVNSPISNRYLSDTKLKVLTAEERFMELNGSYTAEGESTTLAHRYSAGISREDVNSDDKLKGIYAAYSATYNEGLSIGAVFRSGKEKNGADDISARRYGVAAEADAGPFTFTAGYFRADRTGLPGLEDYMAEALYRMLPGIAFAGRFEMAIESGKESAKSQSYMARYNILSNAFTQLEYRHLEDGARVLGGGELEDKIRLLLVALF